MATIEEKAAVDTVDQASSTGDHGNNGRKDDPFHGRGSEEGDEQIIRNLENTGEEVGLTWRTIMAAAVSFCD